MTPQLATAVVTALGAILVAAFTYMSTKRKERDAELRKEKLEHYKDFVSALSGVISDESTADGQRAFSRASNRLMLIAPQNVIEALRDFQNEIKRSNTNKSVDRHNELMSKLFYAMRHDLGVSPADDPATFKVWLFAAGVKPDER